MRSSSLKLDPRRRTYVRMISEIRHALNAALLEENLKQGDLADRLGCDKSFVSRKLAGTGNMTLETLADLAYALNRPVKVTLPSRGSAIAVGRNIKPDLTTTTQAEPANARVQSFSTVGSGLVNAAVLPA